MPMKIDFKLTGAKELEKSMKHLPVIMRKKHWPRALVRALKPIRDKAKSNARANKDTGALSKSIISKAKVYKGGEIAWGGVGADRDYVAPAPAHRKTKSGTIRPAFYSHLVEFGTTHSPAKPFLRPALDSEGGTANDILTREADASFDLEVAQLGRNRPKKK
jgi:HK97 gp10 family phage protein